MLYLKQGDMKSYAYSSSGRKGFSLPVERGRKSPYLLVGINFILLGVALCKIVPSTLTCPFPSRNGMKWMPA